MYKYRKITFIFFISLIILLITSGISFAISSDEQAKVFAKDNLTDALKFIKPNYRDFHFESQEQVMSSYLGEPLKFNSIDINNYDENKDIISQLKPFPFYVFPVMSEGKIITDFTIVLFQGNWKVVNIGGNMTKLMDEFSKQVNIPISSNKVFKFGGETFFLNEEFGYSPYFSEKSIGLEKQKKLSPKCLKEGLKHVKSLALTNNEKGIAGSSVNNRVNLESFRQNASVLERIYKFINHKL